MGIVAIASVAIGKFAVFCNHSDYTWLNVSKRPPAHSERVHGLFGRIRLRTGLQAYCEGFTPGAHGIRSVDCMRGGGIGCLGC